MCYFWGRDKLPNNEATYAILHAELSPQIELAQISKTAQRVHATAQDSFSRLLDNSYLSYYPTYSGVVGGVELNRTKFARFLLRLGAHSENISCS